MALVNTSDVFPSLRVLETDATGELGEITGSPATFSSLDLYGDSDVLITANESGDNNDLNVIVIENQGGSDRVDYDSTIKQIQVKFASNFTASSGATPDSTNYNSAFDVTAVQAGDLNGLLQFTVVDNVAGATQNEVKVSASDGDITVCLFDDITTGNSGAGYTNADIHALVTDSLASWNVDLNAVVTISALSNGGNPAVNFSDTLVGGQDASGQVPSNGTASIVNLINNSSATNSIVTASGGTFANLPSVISTPVFFQGGNDAQVSTFDFNQKYVCLRIDEIHSLLESESGDARKVLWGMLETYTQHVLGQSVENRPENFLVTRGNPTLVIDQAGTRLRQTYTANAFYAVGDLDLEAETGV